MKKFLLISLIGLIFTPIIIVNTYSQQIVIGYVIKVENNLLYLDRGKNDNVRIGDEFKLLRDMAEGRRDKRIGVVKITQVFAEISVGKLTEVVSNEKPSVLDKIEIAPIIEIPQSLEKMGENDEFLTPIIKHNEIHSVLRGRDIDITVRADAVESLKDIYVMYSGDLNNWERTDLFSYRGDIYFGKIPFAKVINNSLNYYIAAEDIDGRRTAIGSQMNPINVTVTDKPLKEMTSMLSDKRHNFYDLLIPGYTQVKGNQLGKGYMIISLQSAALLGGIIADKHNGVYFGSAAVIYLFNVIDGYLSLRK